MKLSMQGVAGVQISRAALREEEDGE
jgi:hypothetical protein